MIRRPSRAQIDEGILDSAAALFARRGIKDTAVQAIADDVGYSKAAVLQRFGTKALLLERVIARCDELSASLLASVSDLADGPERDEKAVTELTDIALANPGFVAMLISAATNQRDTELAEGMEPVGKTAMRAFGLGEWDPDTADLERTVRVAGCLAAVSLLSTLYQPAMSATTARPLIIAAAYATLHGPGPSLG